MPNSVKKRTGEISNKISSADLKLVGTNKKSIGLLNK